MFERIRKASTEDIAILLSLGLIGTGLVVEDLVVIGYGIFAVIVFKLYGWRKGQNK